MSTIDRRVLPSWTGFVLWLIFYLSYKCSYKGSGGRYIISSVYCCNHRYIRHLNMSISEQKLTFAAIFRKHWCSRCHRPDGRVGVKYWLNHDVIRVKREFCFSCISAAIDAVSYLVLPEYFCTSKCRLLLVLC